MSQDTFKIIGDQVFFGGYLVGELTEVPATIRDACQEALEGYGPPDHEGMSSFDEGHATGYEDGYEEGKSAILDKLQALLQAETVDVQPVDFD